ncbi:MAG: hypothetical protein V3U54_12590 [Thermodesulfobacteriota bacterium]
MNKPHLDHIETAFLQLSFAIKLWNYLDVHKIDKSEFDIDLTIKDESNCVCLLGNEFERYEDIQLASENNISICFGAAAITLWEAISEKTGLTNKTMNPDNSKEENIAALSYMIRCCFAHGTAVPVWSIKNIKYKTIYTIGSKPIDLRYIAENQPFDYSSIGGYESLWLIKNEAELLNLL